MRARRLVLLGRHVYRVWRGGQTRFRLETYGLYYPALPYTRPWWRVSPRVTGQLLRQIPSYSRWIEEMDDLACHGADHWWRKHVPQTDGTPLEGADQQADHAF